MDDIFKLRGYAGVMLDYARQRVKDALSTPHMVVLVTDGPAGLQAGEFPCEAVDLALYLLVANTSDHLFNLEHYAAVTVLAVGWELKGKGRVVPLEAVDFELSLLQEASAQWCTLVRVDPGILQIHRKEGWGNLETIEIEGE
jgi:hypothetical protein